MPIPKKGAIPGRKSGENDSLAGGLGNLLGIGDFLNNLFKGLGKTIESIQDLNLEDLEKLAEAQGNEQAKENIKKLKEKLGKKEGVQISDLLSGQGLNLSKLIDLAGKQGGEFSQKFAGGKGIIRGGIRGSLLGVPFGGNMPFGRRGPQETKFEVKGTRPKKVQKTMEAGPKEVKMRKLEIDPIEENENSIIIRGYMAGVDEKDIVCQIENEKTLKISARGERKYEKEIELSSPVEKIGKWSYRNGIIEVILTKEKIAGGAKDE